MEILDQMYKPKSYLLCFVAVALFSTYEIVGKIFGNHIPPVTITAIRFFIGGLLLLPFALKEPKLYKNFNYSIAGKILLVGILNVAISMVFLQLSVFYGKAVLAAIIFSANPVFVGLFSILLEKERLSKVNILGLTIGLLGLVLIIISEESLFRDSGNMLLGIMFGILSGVVFALYTVLSKKYVKEIGSFKLNSFAFLSGSFILLIIAIFFNIDIAFEINRSNTLSLLYLGIIVTGIGYYLYFEGLKNLSTSKGAMIFYMKPVIAGILAYIFLGETLTFMQILGFAIVILGINTENLLKTLSLSKNF